MEGWLGKSSSLESETRKACKPKEINKMLAERERKKCLPVRAERRPAPVKFRSAERVGVVLI